jgi:hypothetical protein
MRCIDSLLPSEASISDKILSAELFTYTAFAITTPNISINAVAAIMQVDFPDMI